MVQLVKLNRLGIRGGIKQAFLSLFTDVSVAYSLQKLSKEPTAVIRARRTTDNSEQDFSAKELTDGTILDFANHNTGVLPLDNNINPITALSLRYLGSDVTGAVVRVRRSSDNAEADFTPTEIQDGTLTTWTGSGDGQVTRWYDQRAPTDTSAQWFNGTNNLVTTASTGVDVTNYFGACTIKAKIWVDDNSLTQAFFSYGQATYRLYSVSGTWGVNATQLATTTVTAGYHEIEMVFDSLGRCTSFLDNGVEQLSGTIDAASTLGNTTWNLMARAGSLYGKGSIWDFELSGSSVQNINWSGIGDNAWVDSVNNITGTFEGDYSGRFNPTDLVRDNDAIQATALNQPTIVNAGVLQLENNLPSMDMFAKDFDFPTPITVQSISVVANAQNVSSGYVTLLDETNDLLFTNNDSTFNNYCLRRDSDDSIIIDATSYISGTQASLFYQIIQNDMFIRYNNALGGVDISTTAFNQFTGIGNATTAAKQWTGNLQELILYPSTVSESYNITGNQVNYYNITPLGQAQVPTWYDQRVATSKSCIKPSFTPGVTSSYLSASNMDGDLIGKRLQFTLFYDEEATGVTGIFGAIDSDGYRYDVYISSGKLRVFQKRSATLQSAYYDCVPATPIVVGQTYYIDMYYGLDNQPPTNVLINGEPATVPVYPSGTVSLSGTTNVFIIHTLGIEVGNVSYQGRNPIYDVKLYATNGTTLEHEWTLYTTADLDDKVGSADFTITGTSSTYLRVHREDNTNIAYDAFQPTALNQPFIVIDGEVQEGVNFNGDKRLVCYMDGSGPVDQGVMYNMKLNSVLTLAGSSNRQTIFRHSNALWSPGIWMASDVFRQHYLISEPSTGKYWDYTNSYNDLNWHSFVGSVDVSVPSSNMWADGNSKINSESNSYFANTSLTPYFIIGDELNSGSLYSLNAQIHTLVWGKKTFTENDSKKFNRIIRVN